MNLRALILTLVLLLACGQDRDDSALRDYVRTTFGDMPLTDVSAIFVITEDGCPVCDRRFAELVRPRVGCERCLFIIRAQGSAFSMKGFMDERPNLRFDDGTFKRLGLLQGSGVIVLQEGHIDRVLPMDVDGIEAQLAFAGELLDSLSKALPR